MLVEQNSELNRFKNSVFFFVLWFIIASLFGTFRFIWKKIARSIGLYTFFPFNLDLILVKNYIVKKKIVL